MSAVLLSGVIGCSGGEASTEDARGSEPSREEILASIDLPSDPETLLHEGTLDDGSKVSLFEVGPGQFLVTEAAESSAIAGEALAGRGIREIFERFFPGTPIPDAVEQAQERADYFSANPDAARSSFVLAAYGFFPAGAKDDPLDDAVANEADPGVAGPGLQPLHSAAAAQKFSDEQCHLGRLREWINVPGTFARVDRCELHLNRAFADILNTRMEIAVTTSMYNGAGNLFIDQRPSNCFGWTRKSTVRIFWDNEPKWARVWSANNATWDFRAGVLGDDSSTWFDLTMATVTPTVDCQDCIWRLRC